jgi:CubicO group peptidase (beta-lactamase class C family)
VFEIASVTKVFTTLLLADIAQRGEVALGDPLAAYLPANVRVPQRRGRQITLVDLATHTSGLPPQPPDLPGLDDPAAATYSAEQLYSSLSTYQLETSAPSGSMETWTSRCSGMPWHDGPGPTMRASCARG